METPLISLHHLEQFLEELNTFAAENLSQNDAAEFSLLAKLYFRYYPLEELVGRHLSDIFGAICHWRRFIQYFDATTPKIRIFNPNLAEDGWVCPHTSLVVLQQDMPFLVDSIRIELNRRNIAIHSLKSTVLQVVRDNQRQLVSVSAPLSDEQQSTREALIVFEIGLHTNETLLAELQEAIVNVLVEVAAVVADYQPILKKTIEVEQNLHFSTGVVNAQHAKESQEYLRWLMDDHFTFLGFSEYEFAEDDRQKKILRELTDKRLGVFATRKSKQNITEVDKFNEGMARFYLVPHLITFSKSSVRSRVHRYAYSDYVVVKKFNSQGEVIGEYRFIGLYTSSGYSSSPYSIPLIREKVAKVFELTGLDAGTHYGKSFTQILETFPRDEIFLSSGTELYETLLGVAKINERSMVRLFVRRDPFGKFFSCVIYVPRDYFSTRVRLDIQRLIGKEIGSTECEFTTYFSESILARVYLVFKVDSPVDAGLDIKSLQEEIVSITRSWEDQLQYSLVEAFGEEQAMRNLQEYRTAFSSSYQEHFDSRTAVHDIQSMMPVDENNDIAMSFYQPANAADNALRFKIFHRLSTLELSDVIPVLENLGLRVIAESSYHIRRTQLPSIWLHDFQLQYNSLEKVVIRDVKQKFQDAFSAIWYKRMDSDPFNRLILSCGLNWREVVVLRAYAAYMRQTLFNFSDAYIASALVNHAGLTRMLIDFFITRFDPTFNRYSHPNEDFLDESVIELCREKILNELTKVENLNEDRIIRRYLTLIDNSLRTNYFQLNASGAAKEYLSIKLSPRHIDDVPEPRPLYEIFVFSPRFEGVHLRSAKVARGGLRWSDRLQDYRTEVLGLVKAQQVKNAVIVPNGAKGGFVCKHLPSNSSREAILEEGITCYKTFIRGLLDLTDNYVDGEIQSPHNTLTFDEDDPYLVVAADKGTATFSDIANSISTEYNFWLGDAFASGGSQGYDHKAMGITARGAWISVQRHFKERNINVQLEPISIVGIGDMAGDVFGNGLLLSQSVQLVAAFNHLHIFIDPAPDPLVSFGERERLFKLPRSNWSDYQKSLISDGGGIFSRAAKSIVITPQMKKVFDIQANALTPNELISALLKAPVDLIWNGGIGTYIKSSLESHADAGDKANDGLRINGDELRCKVFGEGGNLGMTQRGRVEFCLKGGACNTDFIDNAGGVDCSDHEVNAKILLNEIVANGDLTQKQRNQLLLEMTDNVAKLVLNNNYRQTQAISVAHADALHRSAEYRRFMVSLQTSGRLNRKLEFLPSDDALLERQTQGKGLTRPELSILISYAKAMLKEDLTAADIADDPYITRFIEGAFPQKICKLYPEKLRQHRLKREIVATQIANDMINNMGITFAQRLMESTGASVSDVAKAYIIARDIYQLDEFLRHIETVDHVVDPKLQLTLIHGIIRKVRRATRWFLRNRRSHLNPAAEVALFAPVLITISANLPSLLQGDQLLEWQTNRTQLQEAGLPEFLVDSAGRPSNLYSGLSVAESVRVSQQSLPLVSRLYFYLGNYLSLPWFSSQISDLKVDNFWQAMARETYMDDLESQLRSLSVSLVRFVSDEDSIPVVVERWSQQHQLLIGRWKSMVNELQSVSGTDFAMFSVALRDLLDLAQASQHTEILNNPS